MSRTQLSIYELADDGELLGNSRWWIGFCNSFEGKRYDGYDAWFRARDQKLAEWNAWFGDGCIEFENDADATMFLLRWS